MTEGMRHNTPERVCVHCCWGAPHINSTNYSKVYFHLVFSVYLSCERYIFYSWRVCDLLWKNIVGGGFVVGFKTVIYHIADPGCFSRNVFMTALISFFQSRLLLLQIYIEISTVIYSIFLTTEALNCCHTTASFRLIQKDGEATETGPLIHVLWLAKSDYAPWKPVGGCYIQFLTQY